MCAQIELFAPDLALVCTVSCQLDWIITIMWSELINTHFRIYLCSRNPKLRTLLNYWDNILKSLKGLKGLNFLLPIARIKARLLEGLGLKWYGSVFHQLSILD